jgi:hypothetical protein
MKTLLVSVAFLSAANITMAQLSITPLSTSHVSIFKNGTYFITKEGQANVVNGQFAVEPPKTALNGTWWLAAGKENKIKSISIKPDSVKVTKPVQTVAEFISSNVGKTITIAVPRVGSSTGVREISGRLKAYFAATQVAQIETADGRLVMCDVALAIEAYSNMQASNSFVQDSLVRMAKVSLQNNAGQAPVSILALQTGMSWTPSYLLKLNDDKTARLELKATIENTSERIKGAAVDLVIGSPQLFYGKTLDAICTDYFNSQLLDANRYDNNMYQNAVTVPDMMMERDDKDEAPAAGSADYSTEGEKTNDLYYFSLGNLDIEPQSKTIVPLLTSEVGYKDLYELDILDYSRYWNTNTIDNDPDRVLTTWHILSVENTGKAPFTTGPVFVVDEKGKPIAQDEMKYTPLKAKAKIKLSKAIDVQSKNTEELVSRDGKKVRIDGHDYELAIVKGKVVVRNLQGKAIKISVVKSLVGKVTSQSDGGSVTATPQNVYNNRNNNSTITWEKEIAAQGTMELEYVYEVLVL